MENASGFSVRSRKARFTIIVRCLETFTPGIKLLDYGCYDAALSHQLSTNVKRYIGVDENPKFVKLARVNCNGPGYFICGNILEDAVFDRISTLKPDVIVASGVMSYRGDAAHYPELLSRLFTAARHGVIFNVLAADIPQASKRLVMHRPGIIRWKPEMVIRLVRACGCNSWEIIRSYLHNDMTVVMRKQWTHFT